MPTPTVYTRKQMRSAIAAMLRAKPATALSVKEAARRIESVFYDAADCSDPITPGDVKFALTADASEFAEEN